MPWDTIHKTPPAGVAPNLANYTEFRRSFNWEMAEKALDGLPGGDRQCVRDGVSREQNRAIQTVAIDKRAGRAQRS